MALFRQTVAPIVKQSLNNGHLVWLRSCALHLSQSMASPYFPYGTYSYLWSGRDSDLVRPITRRGKTRGIQWYFLF